MRKSMAGLSEAIHQEEGKRICMLHALPSSKHMQPNARSKEDANVSP